MTLLFYYLLILNSQIYNLGSDSGGGGGGLKWNHISSLLYFVIINIYF
jgi:hypothetical protein